MFLQMRSRRSQQRNGWHDRKCPCFKPTTSRHGGPERGISTEMLKELRPGRTQQSSYKRRLAKIRSPTARKNL